MHCEYPDGAQNGQKVECCTLNAALNTVVVIWLFMKMAAEEAAGAEAVAVNTAKYKNVSCMFYIYILQVKCWH